MSQRALGPGAAAAALGRDPRGGPAVDLTYTGSDAMLVLCLLTSLAGFLTGAALAHHLGYQAGLLPFPAERCDWQALALTGGLGLLALELAIAVFGKRADQET